MLLTAAMVVGMMSGIIPGKVAVVQAASTTPSVTAYATKTQLMNDFTPNEDGTATNLCRLSFGRNSSSQTQEWYILGKDSGVADDNIAIFATSNITKGKYNSNTADGNAYDTCILRSNLQGIEKNTSYFSSTEQKLLNATEVVCIGSDKNAVSYTVTVTDKLYVPVPDYSSNSDSTLGVGKNQRKITMSSYWNDSGDNFWLRSGSYWYGGVTVATPGGNCVMDAAVDK